MNPPHISRYFLFLPLALLSAPGPSCALERSDAVRRELDCVGRHFDEGREVGWVDVCDATDVREDYSSRREKVEEALDLAEEARHPKGMDTDQSFAVQAGSLPPMKISPSPDETGRNDAALPPRKKDPFSSFELIPPRNPLRTLDFGTETYYYSYDEPGFVEETGPMFGVYGRYTHRTSENKPLKKWWDLFRDGNKINMFRLDGRWATGDLNYKSQGSGELGKRYYMTEWRGLAGYDIPVCRASRLTPYVGFGYRYYLDDNGGDTTTTGHLAYDREQSYYYLPLGIETHTPLWTHWSVAMELEYDLLLSGQNKSHFEDIGDFNTLVFKQEDGTGLRAAVRLARSHPKLDFLFEPFIRYWHIQDSRLDRLTSNDGSIIYSNTYLEPDNETLEGGFRMGVRY